MPATPDNREEQRATATMARYVYWQDEDAWLGYLEEFPDYPTQGKSLDDLEDHLRDLHVDLTGGNVRGARRVAQLQVS